MSGVGYVPDINHRTSRYQLGPGGQWRQHPLDLGANPGTVVGGVNSPFFLDFNVPGVRETFELRYGPGSAPPGRGGWQGPNNEYRAILRDALIWKFGGGEPTDVEVTDVQATNDTTIYHPFLELDESPDRPHPISDPRLPAGLQQRRNPFLGHREWVFNTLPAEEPPPVDPPPPPPPVDPPPVDPPTPHVCPMPPYLPGDVLAVARHWVKSKLLLPFPALRRGLQRIVVYLESLDTWQRNPR